MMKAGRLAIGTEPDRFLRWLRWLARNRATLLTDEQRAEIEDLQTDADAEALFWYWLCGPKESTSEGAE